MFCRDPSDLMIDIAMTHFVGNLYFADTYGEGSIHLPLLNISITVVYMRRLMQTRGESDMHDPLLIFT